MRRIVCLLMILSLSGAQAQSKQIPALRPRTYLPSYRSSEPDRTLTLVKQTPSAKPASIAPASIPGGTANGSPIMNGAPAASIPAPAGLAPFPKPNQVEPLPPRVAPVEQVAQAKPAPSQLQDFEVLALTHNPTLRQAIFLTRAAYGRAVQAGLYPNPVMEINGDELGDRTGPPGIWTAPRINQEIVTGGKLKIAKSAACKEVEQFEMQQHVKRLALLADVRKAFVGVLTLQNRIAVLKEIVELSHRATEQTERLLKSQLVSKLELRQLEVEENRFTAELESAEQELYPAFQRLAAVIGVPNLPVTTLTGSLESPLPEYSFDIIQPRVTEAHPETLAACLGVERAKLLHLRATKEPIPNVTLSTGYQRQSQNRSDDWLIGVSMPIPVWNRNQGNILATHAEICEAEQQVIRTKNDLSDRLASALRDYASSAKRAERYRTSIIPKVQEAYSLAVKAYEGGQFEYLRVLAAQRSLAETRLEYLRAQGEAWQAAALVSGLTMEESWNNINGATLQTLPASSSSLPMQQSAPGTGAAAQPPSAIVNPKN